MARKTRMALYDGEEKIQLQFVSFIEGEPELDGTYKGAQPGKPPTISVVASRSEFVILWTIFHELLHRWEDVSGRALDHDKLDEVARYLARVQMNSPELTRYILNSSKRGKRGK